MDPWLLLGVGAGAGRAELRAVHRRLRRQVDPIRGGTAELVRLVDAAYGAVTSGQRQAPLSADPHRVLGLAAGAPPPAIHAAFRRLARRVHPDLGGTDELFRVVGAAHEALTRTPVRRTRPTWRPTPWNIPPRPPRRPAPVPYRAPAPQDRPHPPAWRAWRDLGEHFVVLAAAAVVIAAAGRLDPRLFAAAVILVVGLSGTLLRPALEGALRSVVIIRGARVRVAPEIEPERFLEETCLDAPVGRQDEAQLYLRYIDWCMARRRGPIPHWVFVERLRGLGLLYVKASIWDAGLWVGIRLREV